MSLATTCPACGTCFRVVQDQLKISEGWVRCGHCQDVFNALEGLFELEATPQVSPPAEPPSTQAPAVVEPDAPSAHADDESTIAAPAAPLEEAPMEQAWQPTEFSGGIGDLAADPVVPDASTEPPPNAPQEEQDPATSTAISLPASADAIEPAALAVDEPTTPPGLGEQEAAATEPVAPVDGAVEAPPNAAAMADFTADLTSLPGFVRLAERRARWERPGVRAVLSALMGALLLGIVGQVAWHWRDRLAYAWPALRPALAFACGELGCTLRAPRVIDALVVDNATMTRPPGADNYRLAVTLHNRADHPVAAPHLELTLSDGQGGVLIRRVLTPTDFRGADDETVGPQSDATWTLEFAARDPGRIAGYTVAAFYP